MADLEKSEDSNEAIVNYGLLSLLYEIRVAAGDKAGKLMQEELVAHIAALRVGADRYRHYRDNTIPALCVRAARAMSLPNVRIVGQRLDLMTDAAITAERAAKQGGGHASE